MQLYIGTEVKDFQSINQSINRASQSKDRIQVQQPLVSNLFNQ